ncbi:MAG TPA: GNAT family N-acetyltransferase [Chryseolinea sp.]|nr:GNAT family N-acetyltransferase [Chryseolinea sp.]
MERIEILDASGGEERIIRDLAWATWWTAYRDIISDEQIHYMLETIYSEEILRRQIAEGDQQFIILRVAGQPSGFAAYSARANDPSIYKLHKLYVIPGCHGKGFGRRLLNEVTSRLRARQVKALELNVNRQNPALKFYESCGFVVIRQEDIPIGPYWMNDYVMRLSLDTQPIA